MNLRRTARIALFMLAPLCGMGCQAGGRPAVAAGFKVALLVPGPVSDAGWNGAAYQGLQKIGRRLHASIALVQTNSPADFEDAFRDFASRHFSLIFANGFEYSDSAMRLAAGFPATIFVISSGNVSAANVASVAFRVEDAAYIEGVLSGLMSRSGVVGAVGGIELPSVKLFFEAFRLGFTSTRPDGRLLVSYIGNFNDVGAAKEAALAQISRGADLLLHDADAAGLGVFQAAAERRVYAFGVSSDQNQVAPNVILASAVANIPKAFLEIAQEVQKNRFKPGMIEYGMRDGMVSLVLNPRLADRIPPAFLARMRKAEEEVIAGKVTLPTLASVASRQAAP